MSLEEGDDLRLLKVFGSIEIDCKTVVFEDEEIPSARFGLVHVAGEGSRSVFEGPRTCGVRVEAQNICAVMSAIRHENDLGSWGVVEFRIGTGDQIVESSRVDEIPMGDHQMCIRVQGRDPRESFTHGCVQSGALNPHAGRAEGMGPRLDLIGVTDHDPIAGDPSIQNLLGAQACERTAHGSRKHVRESTLRRCEVAYRNDEDGACHVASLGGKDRPSRGTRVRSLVHPDARGKR